jgi:hypothetical protein
MTLTIKFHNIRKMQFFYCTVNRNFFFNPHLRNFPSFRRYGTGSLRTPEGNKHSSSNKITEFFPFLEVTSAFLYLDLLSSRNRIRNTAYTPRFIITKPWCIVWYYLVLTMMAVLSSLALSVTRMSSTPRVNPGQNFRI